ncbi:hypothetical protein CGCF413_v004518 [Colletotrichum fructicola]|nr:hypothetical protein CGCF413_v004518 [Colletotrichum fructicola]
MDSESQQAPSITQGGHSQLSQASLILPIPSKLVGSVDPSTWGRLASFNPTAPGDDIQIDTALAFYAECYHADRAQGRDLWSQLLNDFEDWPEELFEKANPNIVRLFRDTIMAQGVNVKMNRGSVARNTYNATQGDNFHIWTTEEINNMKKRSKTFRENCRDPEFLEDISEDPDVVEARYHQARRGGQATPGPSSANTPGFAQVNPPLSPTPTQAPQTTSAVTPEKPQIANTIPEYMPLPRQLTDLGKLYTDDMKYGGEMYDVLESKLFIFRDSCHKVGISHSQFAGAFSIMLKDEASDFYFDYISNNPTLDFHDMVSRVKQHFETEETRQTYLSEWRNTTLLRVLRDNPDKTKLQALDILLTKLKKIQRALSTIHQSDEALRDQVLSACRGVKECDLCLYSPAPTYQGVRNQLRSALGTAAQHSQEQQQFPAAPANQEENLAERYWTDRTYNGYGREARFGRPPRRQQPFLGSNSRNQRSLPAPTKKCYICGKTGCWSTKHPTEERRNAYTRFKASQHLQDSSMPAFCHFLAWHEGVEGIDTLEADDPIAQYVQAMGISGDEDSEENDNFPTSFFTNTMTTVDGRRIATILADQSVLHAVTKEDPYSDQPAREPTSLFTLEGRYSSTTFQGIMPDSGAAGFSTAGHPQFVALRKHILPSVDLDTSAVGEASIRFGRGDAITSIGTTKVPTPFGPITFHVVPSDTPFLLCLQDMDRLGIKFDNLNNFLQQGDIRVPIIRKWGHPWMLLEREKSLAWNHLTEVELRRLHRRFGHPSVQRLHTVLQRAGHPVEITALEQLTKICQRCQMNGAAPSRFKFTLQDDHSFNYEVIVDIFYLDGNKPILHVVDTATAFNAARFLEDISAKQTWEALRMCWIDVYQGPPDWIVTDAGTNFRSEEFRQSARSMAISIKEIPIEAHNSIGKVERYHKPLRRAYEIIKAEDPSLRPEVALQMAIKAINDTAGPNGLVPTLLVFGAYPRINHDSPPSPEILQRATAIRKAMEEVRRLHASRQVKDALNKRNGPDTQPTLNLPLQSQVRVWREKKGWQGPFRLLATDGENCTIDHPRGPRIFRSTMVKPFHQDPEEITEISTNPLLQAATEVNQPPQANSLVDEDTEVVLDEIVVAGDAPRPRRGRPRKNLCPLSTSFLTAKEASDAELALELRKKGIITSHGHPFEQSTRKEIDSLISRGVFEFIPFDETKHRGVRIFKSRIVNEVKGKTTNSPYEKSRLVVQGYADDGKDAILTQSPTIQRASQRLILAIAPALLAAGKSLWLRDITQAYVQSETRLNRTILAHLPIQIRHLHPEGTIMAVVKPLYGIAEAGTHWWATYHKHHREKLQMVTSSYDPCLLISSTENPDFACVGMQTDDTIGLSDESFSRREDEELKKAAFTAKPKQTLTADEPLTFNGGIVTMINSTLSLRQKGQGEKLRLVIKSPVSKQQYVEQRARGAYIASICQPEACFDLSAAAQHQDPSPEDIKNLNRRLKWQMDSLDRGLTFIPVDLATAKLFVFVDGSFANNADLTSQLGFVIILANEQTNDGSSEFTIHGNIVHFSSTKSKRVTRSVLASEIYGMVAGVDMAYAIASTIRMINSNLKLAPIQTVVCTDSYSLYECLVKLGTTKEKRLMIDIMALRQSYERRELNEIRWINGDDNLADAFTKSNPNRALERFVDKNKAVVRMEGWVTRA